ncbi:pentapeptide repeat-containing protein [Mucilaginibacter sp.]|jgi:uncharacterized protein YjbI with pentapeptide repeats|uniref:pentapeptide repeat-containing protein n=1 Tax=Mucilaginibacter sp. TaxID=1882438 RepID=UPI00356715C7
METIEIKKDNKQIIASESMLEDSKFTMVCLNRTQMKDIAATNVKISDANLSNLEIEGAQLGGAYIHNIGMPPEGHPFYDPNARQRPLKFENCDLNGSEIINCDLSNVTLSNCNTAGMTINGILVDDLLKAYNK